MAKQGPVSRWRYVAPNAVTCVGIGVGLASMFLAMSGATAPAAWMIIVAVLLDKVDGTVARLLGASSRFGEQMDSFSDLVTFGVAPAVLLLAATQGGAEGPLPPAAGTALYRFLAYAAATLYVVAAALRLARFNLTTGAYGPDFFFGLPTTVVGALLATAYLMLWKYPAPALQLYAMPIAYVVLALLMVSRLPLPKLRLRRSRAVNLFQLVNIVLVYFHGLTWYLFPEHLWFPEYMLGITLLYVFTGTIWAFRSGIRPPPAGPGGPVERS